MGMAAGSGKGQGGKWCSLRVCNTVVGGHGAGGSLREKSSEKMMAEWGKHVLMLRMILSTLCFCKASSPAEHTFSLWRCPQRPCCGRRCSPLKWLPLVPLPCPRARRAHRPGHAVLPPPLVHLPAQAMSRCCRPWFMSDIPISEVWESCKFYVNLFLILVESCFNEKERRGGGGGGIFFKNKTNQLEWPANFCVQLIWGETRCLKATVCMTLLAYPQLTSLKIAGDGIWASGTELNNISQGFGSGTVRMSSLHVYCPNKTKHIYVAHFMLEILFKIRVTGIPPFPVCLWTGEKWGKSRRSIYLGLYEAKHPCPQDLGNCE